MLWFDLNHVYNYHYIDGSVIIITLNYSNWKIIFSAAELIKIFRFITSCLYIMNDCLKINSGSGYYISD